MRNSNSICAHLRTELADECGRILNMECDADMVTIGSLHSDIMLRVAFLYDIDAETAANALERGNIVLFGESAVCSVRADGKYVNVMLCDEFIEHLADRIITEYPLPNEIGDDYALQRAYTLSRVGGFSDVHTDMDVRVLFWELVKCTSATLPNTKQRFLSVQAGLAEYKGFGKVADVAARIFTDCERRTENED